MERFAAHLTKQTQRFYADGDYQSAVLVARRLLTLVYRAALGAGGTDNGAPGLRGPAEMKYYAAFVLDPDGNNIEAGVRE